MAAVSCGVKLPRSKISATIGPASAASPTVAGTLTTSMRRSARDTASRMPSTSSRAAWRETTGSVAVAMDTPNSPIGRYMTRNA